MLFAILSRSASDASEAKRSTKRIFSIQRKNLIHSLIEKSSIADIKCNGLS